MREVYSGIGPLLKDIGGAFVIHINGEVRLHILRRYVGSLPVISGENLDVCKEYAKKNENFAYKYDSSCNKITVWDKRTEEYKEVSAPAYQELESRCGFGENLVKLYAENLTQSLPTPKTCDAAEIIYCEFIDFKLSL